MSKVFPGSLATAPGTRNAYVTADSGVVAMMVGDDAQERAAAVARALAAHDKLVAMVLLLKPAWGHNGASIDRDLQELMRAGPFDPSPPSPLFCQQYGRAKRPAPLIPDLSAEDREAVLRAGPGPIIADPDYAEVGPYVVDDICIAIGSAVRRRNRSQSRGDQPIGPSMEYAATDLVLQALSECGYKVTAPGQESTADSADHLCKLALADVIAECDAVRAVLKDAGHPSEGRALHGLVDIAIDRERCKRQEEVGKLAGRLNAIREAAA
ncbi:hypothetical protein EB230_17325 [Mesorhizobium sp. NZP2234]|nr:hypothetical protein EB230_17325 [Mesorhizobium sp. NZP2234]